MVLTDIVVATDIGQNGVVGITYIAWRKHRQTTVEQLAGTHQVAIAIATNKRRCHTGIVLSKSRCREVVAVEVVDIYPLVVKVAITQSVLRLVCICQV